jgi:hypothetical protein
MPSWCIFSSTVFHLRALSVFGKMLEGLQLDEEVLSVMREDNDRRLEVQAEKQRLAVEQARSFRDDRVRLVKAVEAERKLSVRRKMVACTVVCAACIKGPAAGGDPPPVKHSTSFSAIDIGGPPERLESEDLVARACSPHTATPYAFIGPNAPDQAKHAEERQVESVFKVSGTSHLDWVPTFEHP